VRALDLSAADLLRVLSAFGIDGPPRIVSAGAGTASPAIVVETPSARLYLKRRNPRYCDEQWIRYDAAVADHLLAAGVPVAPALQALDGRPWAEIDGDVYQTSAWVGGERIAVPSLAQLASVSRVLTRWHEATSTWRPPHTKPVGRLHDPVLSADGLAAFAEQAGAEHRAILDEARSWALRSAEALPDDAYWSLPQAIVQGDVHSQNLHFLGDDVVCIFDYDWVCPAPRIVDLADAILYLGGLRPGPVREADIASLTQAFVLPWDRAFAVLQAYDELSSDELRALPWLMLARWLYSRVDAAQRKIPTADRLSYLTAGYLDPIGEIGETMSTLGAPGLL
jgi:Ser/Thr protein kinase RdoA (MazF antagonist)